MREISNKKKINEFMVQLGRRAKAECKVYFTGGATAVIQYSQALSKIERSHDKDIQDVNSMLRSGLIEGEKLLDLFIEIKPFLYKYPAIDPDSFERAVRQVAESQMM